MTTPVFLPSAIHTERFDAAMLDIPLKEIYRYLGYRGVTPSDEVSARIKECLTKLKEKSAPRGVWQAFPLSLDETGHLYLLDLDIQSKNLYRNCRGCPMIVMMAATIGPGCDFLIRRAEATSMLDAAIYQAAGAAAVEAWCDVLNQCIIRAMAPKGLYPRPRFSPGYGDLPLELQRDFFRILNIPFHCGISLTDTLLMTPSKSVTAFIGFSDKEEPCVISGCELCGHAPTCAFRR